MSDYTKITDYAAKDLLLHGDPAKAVKGTEVGAEFDAIATMSATKADKTDYALLTGSASQAFSVAAANSAAHAVRYDQTALSCAFCAQLSGAVSNVTGDATDYTVICDQEIFDIGSNYNNATGIFTAPVDGKYELTARSTANGVLNTHTDKIAQITTSNRSYLHSQSLPLVAVSEDSQIITALADMEAGDTASFVVRYSGSTKVVDLYGTSTLVYTSFSGRRVA